MILVNSLEQDDIVSRKICKFDIFHENGIIIFKVQEGGEKIGEN